MKKGDFVVRVYSLPSSRCAVIARVAKVARGVVTLEGDSHLRYDLATGAEIDPAMPMISSYLVRFDAGQVEQWRLADV